MKKEPKQSYIESFRREVFLVRDAYNNMMKYLLRTELQVGSMFAEIIEVKI